MDGHTPQSPRSVPPTSVAARLSALLDNYLWCWDERIEGIFARLPTYRGNPRLALTALSAAQRQALETPEWQSTLASASALQAAALDGAPSLRRVAYFSAEFGLHETLPIYSGGLGVLAGDHIKAASDLALPLVAIGLIYRHGYFRQVIDPAGWQHEQYPQLRRERTGLHLVTDAHGTPVQVCVPLGDHEAAVQVWRADVGRVPLLLLDTGMPENTEVDRWITAHLYGGDQDTRLRQEIVLGIGGVRVLRALGYDAIDTFHMNEGHAALLTLELIREERARGLSLEAAEAAVRSRCVFTTHTPVPAGHDAFPHELMRRYLGTYCQQYLGCTDEHISALGGWGAFSMTELALNVSRAANGVSKKHGEVSRSMFPGRTVAAITNGVHHLTWTGHALKAVYDRHLPGWREAPERLSEIARVPGDELRTAHASAKANLVALINDEHHDAIFDADTLTIGFARRFATYKRGTLLFRDRARLEALGRGRLQLVFAGKAHPRDDLGKSYIQSLVREMHQVEVRAVFLENYDMGLARQLVSGVDVWLNNPRRPLEASGTSGMKCLLNGVPNLSVLDGWWIEGYDGTNGWAIGQAYHGGDEDEFDAASLYDLLETSILPEYYDQPEAWLTRMRRAIATAPAFTAARMVREYLAKPYTTSGVAG